jgi:hypothetical protein
MTQSTRKRLRAAGTPNRNPRIQMIWLDGPHVSEEDREHLIRQAIADGRMQETDEVAFAHWETCLSIDCRVCWTDEDRETHRRLEDRERQRRLENQRQSADTA